MNMRPFCLGKSLLVGLFVCSSFAAFAQGNTPPANKFANARTEHAFTNVEDSLKNAFKKQNLSWPPVDMYVRSFKYDRQLEIWVKDKEDAPYKLFKTYRVCMQSGGMGPKRMEGDYQVPEGFYHINEFNPNSNYHLSLGLSYPNSSDKILSDPQRPGSAIYIHGDCVSTGCIPLTDAPMEEVYVLASYVKASGQEFIPVHVFPVRYNVKKSLDYLETNIVNNNYLIQFNQHIRKAFDYFEAKKELPIIMVNASGDYIVAAD